MEKLTIRASAGTRLLKEVTHPFPLNPFFEQTPIDEEDAAARVLDPVFGSLNGEYTPPPAGKFFKDYRITEW